MCCFDSNTPYCTTKIIVVFLSTIFLSFVSAPRDTITFNPSKKCARRKNNTHHADVTDSIHHSVLGDVCMCNTLLLYSIHPTLKSRWKVESGNVDTTNTSQKWTGRNTTHHSPDVDDVTTADALRPVGDVMVEEEPDVAVLVVD